MANVFKPEQRTGDKLKRNKFDLSYVHSTTQDFGELNPIFCKEMIPGDSIEIDPKVMIRSHPIVFPVTTRMRAYVNYYVVRNRLLWKDWESWITKTKDGLSKPWLKLNNTRAKQMISTNSLGDSLGVPSTIAGSFPNSINYSLSHVFKIIFKGTSDTFASVFSTKTAFYNYVEDKSVDNLIVTGSSTTDACSYGVQIILNNSPVPSKFIGFSIVDDTPVSVPASLIPMYYDDDYVLRFGKGYDVTITYDSTSHYYSFNVPTQAKEYLNSFDSSKRAGFYLCIFYDNNTNSSFTSFAAFQTVIPLAFGQPPSRSKLFPVHSVINFDQVIDATDDSVIANNKFVGDSPTIPLDSLPFRAYEMIYNFYFRNDLVSPYMPDGTIDYNRFIPTTEGGEDTNTYVKHYRNWELDAYTSCTPSPQFGIAPLVGLTSTPTAHTATLTFQATDADGNTNNYDVKVGLDGEGNIESIVDFDAGTPSGNLRRIVDLSSSTGISINDFRNVNSFQRYLENMIRRGSLRYADQMEAHFGVRPNHQAIDVPEYIGGFSGDLVSSAVQNSSEGAAPLGDIAGRIDAVIESKHRIKYYATEHCFVMGILTIVPVPTYSQLLPKMFLRTDPFDYFNTEFAKIGKVPIFRREFMPLQSTNVDDVLGYQKANYDLMSSNDEVHGDFRTSLRDFLLNRTWASEPQLNEDFILCKPSSLNNIWAVDDAEEAKYADSKKFMITMLNGCRMLRQIPKYGTSALE